LPPKVWKREAKGLNRKAGLILKTVIKMPRRKMNRKVKCYFKTSLTPKTRRELIKQLEDIRIHHSITPNGVSRHVRQGLHHSGVPIITKVDTFIRGLQEGTVTRQDMAKIRETIERGE